MRWTLLSIWLLLTGCAEPYWHVDMPGYRPASISIREVNDLNAVCKQDVAWTGAGCVFRFPDHAEVFIRHGLTQREYECVMYHEIIGHVVEGKNHDDRRVYALDCPPD